MAQARDLAQVGLQPIFQAGQQRFVAQIRPLALPVLLQVQLAQQGHPRLPLAQLWRPGQQVQAFAPYQAEQRLGAGFIVQARQRFAAEHQLADLDLAFGTQHLFALVPVE
ncbi:hypothetical protein D3C76_651580 [compost metagenome]